MKLPIIGITGPTGAGKGLACKILAERGAYVINADQISHRVILKNRPAYTEILAAFPNHDFLDEHGEIIRRRLAKIVFGDQSKLKTLTNITHKYILEEIHAEIAAVRNTPENYTSIIIDAPLLIESGLHNHCDTVIAITATNDLRIKRIKQRDNLTEPQAQLRANKQTPLDILLKHAHIIIENNGTESELREKLNGY